MKQLTQELFNDCPNWVKSVAVDYDGEGYWLDISLDRLSELSEQGLVIANHAKAHSIGTGFEFEENKINALERSGYRCPKCDYHHAPHQCRECECINCYSFIV